MPIRGLEAHLRRCGLINQRPLSELRARTVGVEVSSWVRSLGILEPLQSATGGPPASLERRFEAAVVHLVDELGVRPLFVFNGLQTMRSERYFGPPGSKREEAWRTTLKEPSKAPQAFEKLSRSAGNAYPAVLQRVLERRGIAWLCAPYQAWGQLGYYSSQGSIEAAFGGLENLLFGCPNIIISIDPEAQLYQMVDAHQVLNAFQLNLSAFLDVCILAGFELCPTFPPLCEETKFRFDGAINIVKQYTSGNAAIKARKGKRFEEYLQTFSRTKAAVKHHLVLPSNSTATLLNAQFAPPDLHEILGPRLPNSVYFFLAMGAIRPNVLNTLLSGCLLESTPLVDSGEYRRLLNELIPMRASVLSLLGTCLNPELLQRDVFTVRWYDPDTQYNVQGSRDPQLPPDLECVLTDSLLGSKVKPGALNIVELLRVVESVSGPPATKKQVETQLEYQAKILQEGLRQLAYIKPDGISLSLFGEAMASGDTSPDFVQAHMTALHLLRLGFITSAPLAMQTEPKRDCSHHVLLISRLMVLIDAQQPATSPWRGPVDLDLMSYSTICRALSFSLGNIFDVVAQVLFTNKRVTAPIDSVRQVALKMPFRHEPPTHLAMLVKHALSDPAFGEEQARAAFPNFAQPKQEMARALRFWNQLCDKVDYILKNASDAEKHVYLPGSKAILAANKYLLKLQFSLK